MKKKPMISNTVSLCAATVIMGMLFMNAAPTAIHATFTETPSTANETIEYSDSQEAPAVTTETLEPARTESLAVQEVPHGTAATPNSIGYAGTFYPFLDMGPSTTANVQKVIDAGYVAASTTFYSPVDGNTTYFSAHNPGVFSYFAMDFEIGGVVTIVDDDGSEHDYLLVERVVMADTKDVWVQNQYTGLSAGEIYTFGSGEESIAIQFCQGPTMYQWYAVKQ